MFDTLTLNTSRLLLTAMALSAMALSSACHIVEGNGVPDAQLREVGDFSRVEVSMELDKLVVDVVDDASQSSRARLSGDENLLEYIDTRVSGGTLFVEVDENIWLEPELPLVLSVRTTSLDGVSVTGATSVWANNVETPDFDATVTGSGSIHLDGSVRTLNVDITGSGVVRATELLSRDAKVDISGSGDVHVCVTHELDVDISGSGDIYYSCNPRSVSSDIAGSGDLHPR